MVPLCWNCYDNHDAIECETLKKLQLPATFLIDNFDVVTPLRVLLLFYRYAVEQNVSPTVADDLKTQIDDVLSMESHCTERRGTWIWNQHAKNVIQPLRDINIDGVFESVQAPWTLTDDFLQKICGALDVNTFEVRTQYFEVWKMFSVDFPLHISIEFKSPLLLLLCSNNKDFPVRGLYTQAALLAHDCIGNTLITVDNDKLLKVYACTDIKAGEIIYNNYTASLYVSLCQVL